ncbi:MAG TPA: hypothetical protein VN794_21810 [Methylomirabilota bacterium]|nr:hypothetical protein [Methylomirabilota bacterium]
MLSGSDAVRGAQKFLEALQDRRDQWPYVHCFPPPNAVDVFVTGAVAIPDQGDDAVEVLRYQVNAGKRFFLRAVILGANVTIVPGQALFTVDRNNPVGVVNKQFMPEHGLTNVSFQLGSFTVEPFVLQRAREFGPLDIVRVKGENVGLSAGDPNFFQCGLFGFEVPTLDVRSVK